MICKISNPSLVSPLFQDWDETMIWSCLDGTMGELYGDDFKNPKSTAAVLGDFTFFAGVPCAELGALHHSSLLQKNYRILVPRTSEWENLLLKLYGNRARRIRRYATVKDSGSFSPEGLTKILSGLPEGFSLKRMDEALYNQCGSMDWSRDLVSQYETWEKYRILGLGVVLTKDGEILSGASSYSAYRGGIEIEIDTRPEYRRRGFASFCGACLILECIKRNLYPSWDAHTEASLSLALKLGYRFSHAYTALEIS